jgi:hypothetical protein
MGNQERDYNSAADPAHPDSPARVGGRGGISTAAEGEGRIPDSGELTREGEDVQAKPQHMGTHKDGVRKAEEFGHDEEHESMGTTGAGRPAGRQGPGENRPTESGMAKGDQRGAGQTNV